MGFGVGFFTTSSPQHRKHMSEKVLRTTKKKLKRPPRQNFLYCFGEQKCPTANKKIFYFGSLFSGNLAHRTPRAVNDFDAGTVSPPTRPSNWVDNWPRGPSRDPKPPGGRPPQKPEWATASENRKTHPWPPLSQRSTPAHTERTAPHGAQGQNQGRRPENSLKTGLRRPCGAVTKSIKMAPNIQKRKTANTRCPLFTDPGPDVRTMGAPPSRHLVHTSDPGVVILAVSLCVSARSPDHEHNDTRQQQF